MYTLGLQEKEVRFICVFVFLLIIIFVARAQLSRELSQFFLDEKLFDEHPQSFVLAPKDPFLKKVDENQIIYSHWRDVFSKRDELMAQRKDFIFADLDTMSLDAYRQGEVVKTFSIKARGREHTFFETPSGSYTIQSKEKNHFSTIGSVWMPWSMHFFGNYFVHGWPYYPDGTPVASTYSGGCIRLSTEDAKELFELTKNNASILVYNKEEIEGTDTNYFQKISPLSRTQDNSDALRGISADSVLAADFDNGQILFEKQKNEIGPIGSLTRLMTGLVALESIDRFRPLTVHTTDNKLLDDEAALRDGDTLKSQDFIYPLILASSNNAANLYAEQVYGFNNLMNQKAQAIGLISTSFKDPTGESRENVSTVQDMFKLLRYISIHKKPLFEVSGLAAYTLVADSKTHTWKNATWTDQNNIFIGGLSGITPDDRETLAAVFRTQLSEQGSRPIAIVILGSQDIKHDVAIIRKYLEHNFVYGNTLTKKNADSPPRIINTGANVFEALRRSF